VSGVSGRSLVLASLAASALLIVVYLIAGGGRYEPTAVADPCASRQWREPEGVEESAQQFALSALDGAACELRVSRETLAVALATPESRRQFAAEYGVADAELEDAVRAGVVRGIDDAEAAGALSPIVADGLRLVAVRLPVDQGIALIEDGSELFDGAGGLIDRIGDLIG
jgi:hypothetical protein